MNPSYVTAASVMALRDQLTEADWAIVRDVQTMRLATGIDLQRLEALRGDLQVRQFRRRLQRLYEAQVLARLDRRVGGKAMGSSSYVYGLGLAGQRLLDDGDGTSVRRPWTPRAAWLNHALATSQVYIELRTAEAAGQLTGLHYEPEPVCWRSFVEGGQATVLKPDAFVSFETGEDEVSVFVEVDGATEGPTTIATKLDVYARHYLWGGEQETHGLYPEVLWLVPTSARQRVIEKVIARQPEETRRLHRVALQSETTRALLEPP